MSEQSRFSTSLIILGNGFDLNCKLKSSFSDFFETINKNDNIWYLLSFFAFYETRGSDTDSVIIDNVDIDDVLWMDVESLIKNVLTMYNDDAKKKNRLSETFGFSTYRDIINLAFTKRCNKKYLYNNSQFSSLKDFFAKRFNNSFDSFDADIFLYDELKSFETTFQKYIKGISLNDEYKNRSKTLLGLLNDGEEAYTILTFNYTLPSKEAVGFYAYGNINYIHGCVEDKIVIGCNVNDLEENSNHAIRMSKSFQRALNNTRAIQMPDRDSVLKIRFYGHSLGEQDLPYFYYIFDYYNISNSDVVLEFCYTPYKNTKDENQEYKEAYILKVFHLINSYSHNRLRSLVDKLALSGRLVFREIKKLD